MGDVAGNIRFIPTVHAHPPIDPIEDVASSPVPT